MFNPLLWTMNADAKRFHGALIHVGKQLQLCYKIHPSHSEGLLCF